MAFPQLGLGQDETYCLIESTVVTGFENLAKEECQEKLGATAVAARGRIIFDMPCDSVSKVKELRSIDNVFVVIYNTQHFGFSSEKDVCLSQLESIIGDCLWKKGIKVWQELSGHSVLSVDEVLEKLDIKSNPESEAVGDNSENRYKNFKFRATCHRSGGSHSFGSPEVAKHFGSALQDRFSWKPDMTEFDLEVVLRIIGEHVYVCLALTKESLHRRNITSFGRTTLRSTIAYNLLHLARIRDGEVVCDPMCGTGAIPIEGSISWGKAVYLCGDNDMTCPEKTLQNLTSVNKENETQQKPPICINAFRWDATCLPLRNSSVDVFVTDLPFGKRSGKKFDNRKLYPSVLNEMARVSQVDKGRAVLLTHDRRSMIKALQMSSKLWKIVHTLTVNVGGLAAGVYYLEKRAASFYDNNSKTAA